MVKENNDIVLEKPTRKVIKLSELSLKYDKPVVTATPSQDYYYSIISSKIKKRSSSKTSDFSHRPSNVLSKQPPLPQYFSMDDLPPSFDEVVATSTSHSRENSIASSHSVTNMQQLLEASLSPGGDSATDPSQYGLLHMLQSWLPWTASNADEHTLQNNTFSDLAHRQAYTSSTPTTATTASPASQQPPLKILGLKIFNSRFHFLLGLSRVS